MKKRSFSLCALFVVLASSLNSGATENSSLALEPVGIFGGVRVFASCEMSGVAHRCAIDTGSPISVASTGDVFDQYQSLGEYGLQGVATVNFDCSVIAVPSFKISDIDLGIQAFLRCSNFSQVLSPMMGLNAFDQRTFSMDFLDRRLTSAVARPALVRPLIRAGFNGRGIIFGAQIGGLNFTAGFDTGAPVTLIDPKIVRTHPSLFKPSSLPVSLELQAAGISVYELLAPIVVSGVTLDAKFVEVVDLSQFSDSKAQIDLLIGANHMTLARWFFDLANDVFAVSTN